MTVGDLYGTGQSISALPSPSIARQKRVIMKLL